MDHIRLCRGIIVAVSIFFSANIFVYAETTVLASNTIDESMVASRAKAPQIKSGYVTLDFKDAEIGVVLNYLSTISGVDIVASPEVTGTVTLKLTDKPWDMALDLIAKNYNYAYERERGVIRVVTLDSLQREELSTEVIHLNYTTVEEASEAVKNMLTERGKLSADTRTNTIIVTDIPTNAYKIKQVMKKIDKRTPQIMIEARIFETLLEDNEKMGIDWTLRIAASGAKRPTTLPFLVSGGLQPIPGAITSRYLPRGQPPTTTSTTPAGGGAAVTSTSTAEFPTDAVTPFPFVGVDEFSYGTLDFSQFKAVLELLEQRRSTEIVSNPRITTLNHKEAKILVGKVYNFPIFSQSSETGQWSISGYESKELGVKLLVIPHVNENNEIVVELKPEISNYLGLEKISDELSAPLWSTREAHTQIMVRDSQTIFIGGLISENNLDMENKVPILGDLFGDVPFFGGLVKSTTKVKEKTELIFFITVYIVKSPDQLMRIMRRGITELSIPEDIIEKEEKEETEAEVFVELSPPGRKSDQKKPHKPFIDWRKKKE